MEMPLISVIVPAYNAEKSIEACCNTVFNQTYPNWELIAIDDGSTDETLSILNGLAVKHPNMIVIHTENRGVCAARNTGMDASEGEFLAFLDADDGLIENALERLHQLITENDCDIAVGGVENAEGLEIWHGNEALIKSQEDHPAGYACWDKLYRKDTVGDVRFVEGRRIHEDTFFAFRCFLKQPDVAVSNEPIIIRDIYVYMFRESASNADFSEKFLDILYFAEEKKRLIEELYPELSGMTENMLLKANMAVLHNLCKTYDPKWRKLEKQCLKTFFEKKEHFIPAIPTDVMWYRILNHRLYPVYKLRYYLKRKRKRFQQNLMSDPGAKSAGKRRADM